MASRSTVVFGNQPGKSTGWTVLLGVPLAHAPHLSNHEAAGWHPSIRPHPASASARPEGRAGADGLRGHSPGGGLLLQGRLPLGELRTALGRSDRSDRRLRSGLRSLDVAPEGHAEIFLDLSSQFLVLSGWSPEFYPLRVIHV